MTDLEKKLQAATKLHLELKENNQVAMLKQGQFNDLLQDIATTHLGYPKETKEFALPELMLKSYLQGLQ